jgi:hypothetical protein
VSNQDKSKIQRTPFIIKFSELKEKIAFNQKIAIAATYALLALIFLD